MFYADFNHYRKTGQSISGLQYRALNFGPVPDHYATIYDNTPELDKRLIEAHDMVSTLLSCNSNKDYETLSGMFLRSVCGLKDMRGTNAGHAVVDLMRS